MLSTQGLLEHVRGGAECGKRLNPLQGTDLDVFRDDLIVVAGDLALLLVALRDELGVGEGAVGVAHVSQSPHRHSRRLALVAVTVLLQVEKDLVGQELME